MEFSDIDNYHMTAWSGVLEDTRLRLHAFKNNTAVEPIEFHSAMFMTVNRNIFYCCVENVVHRYRLNEETMTWELELVLKYESEETGDVILQLKMAWEEQMLLGMIVSRIVIFF